MPRLLLLVTEDWYFWSHRLGLALVARDAGFEVLIATRRGEYARRIADAGLRLVPIGLSRASLNPLREAAAIAELTRIYRRERPSLVHHVAAKPVLYGTLAARMAGGGIPVVNAIAGLGHAFAHGSRATLPRRGLTLAYRLALRSAPARTIVQNPEDAKTLVDACGVPREFVALIRGCGVDLRRFVPRPRPDGLPIVMLAGRLLWTKGVGQLIEAGRRLNRDGRRCRIVLVGDPDTANPSAIAETQLRDWESEGACEWWRRRDDMPETLAQAAIVVLPTMYGEGTPKILIEAAATGRPIVATDVPGCREIVRHGETGLLVNPDSIDDLARALDMLLASPETAHAMGLQGRRIVEQEFSELQMIDQTLAVYRELLGSRYPRAAGMSHAGC